MYFYKRNDVLESKVDAFFKGLSKFNDERYKGRLSVILLGSLSRDEGSWVEENGRCIMVSDIEFFTVYPTDIESLQEFEDFSQKYAKEIFADHISDLFHVDNSFISEAALGKLDKKLLTYDAIHFGKNIVGKNRLDELPKINIDNINLYDIHDILTHRVFSVLCYGLPLKRSGNEIQYRYSLAKNSLDLMTVMLVEHGILESGFLNRYKRIAELDIDENIKNYFEYCLSIKLGTFCPHEFTVEQMEDLFIETIEELNAGFDFKIKNTLHNVKSITRRKLGVLKRTLKYRNVAFSRRHLMTLIETFKADGELTAKEKRDNLVLNGYPVN